MMSSEKRPHLAFRNPARPSEGFRDPQSAGQLSQRRLLRSRPCKRQTHRVPTGPQTCSRESPQQRRNVIDRLERSKADEACRPRFIVQGHVGEVLQINAPGNDRDLVPGSAESLRQSCQRPAVNQNCGCTHQRADGETVCLLRPVNIDQQVRRPGHGHDRRNGCLHGKGGNGRQWPRVDQ